MTHNFIQSAREVHPFHCWRRSYFSLFGLDESDSINSKENEIIWTRKLRGKNTQIMKCAFPKALKEEWSKKNVLWPFSLPLILVSMETKLFCSVFRIHFPCCSENIVSGVFTHPRELFLGRPFNTNMSEKKDPINLTCCIFKFSNHGGVSHVFLTPKVSIILYSDGRYSQPL